MNTFGDDAEIQRKIYDYNENSWEQLQNDLTELHERSHKLQMKFSAEKLYKVWKSGK